MSLDFVSAYFDTKKEQNPLKNDDNNDCWKLTSLCKIGTWIKLSLKLETYIIYMLYSNYLCKLIVKSNWITLFYIYINENAWFLSINESLKAC